LFVPAAGLLPLGILFIDRGPNGWVLAVGLTAITSLLAWQRWAGQVVRLAVVLGVSAAGYATALVLARLAEEQPHGDGIEILGEAIPSGQRFPTTPQPSGYAPPYVRDWQPWVASKMLLLLAQSQQATAPGLGAYLLNVTGSLNVAPLMRIRRPLFDDLVPRSLQPTAEIGACLDLAFDSAVDRAAVVRSDGFLDQYASSSFGWLARYRLAQPGYRVALDGRRGWCCVAVSDPAALISNYSGDPPTGRGDLHIYQIPLSSPPAALKPLAVVPLDASVRSLLMARDRSCVYYLAHSEKETWVGRVPVEEPSREIRRKLPGAAALSLSPDGGQLCAGGFHELAFLDPRTLEIEKKVRIPAVVCDVAIDDLGRVFLTEEGVTPHFMAFDHGGQLFSDFPTNMPARGYLRLHPASTRLYLSWTARTHPGLGRMVVMAGLPVLNDQVHPMWDANPRPLRGEFFLSPDGQVVATHLGKVYRFVGVPPRRPNWPPLPPTR
jgi:hypothetical protein